MGLALSLSLCHGHRPRILIPDDLPTYGPTCPRQKKKKNQGCVSHIGIRRSLPCFSCFTPLKEAKFLPPPPLLLNSADWL